MQRPNEARPRTSEWDFAAVDAGQSAGLALRWQTEERYAQSLLSLPLEAEYTSYHAGYPFPILGLGRELLETGLGY